MMHHKTLDAAYSSEDGTKFVATITTDTIDRDGEVVIPAGMNSKEYERNPVLLYAHDPKMPIGKMETLRRGDGKIEADFRLAPRPQEHQGEWLPDTVGALMKFGALRGVSIGFHAQANGMRSASKADIERYGDGVKRVFSKWNLLEVSVVSVPANQEALVTAIQKGVATAEAVKALGIKADPPAKPSERIEGSERNPEGSAGDTRGGIEIDEATETALKNKVEEHNEKHGDETGKKVNLGMLKAVYRRGAGAFSTSHRPGMTRNQWSMARVNAFLYLVRRGRPENPKYTSDYDLLPKGHPKRSDGDKAYSVTVSVPAVGIDDVRHAARVAMAKACGRFRI